MAVYNGCFVVFLRDREALQNFTDSQFYLRGNKLINYQQLGLKFKLYLCEVINIITDKQRIRHGSTEIWNFSLSLQYLQASMYYFPHHIKTLPTRRS